MDRLKELYEAKTAAQELVARIDNALSSLDRASSWGIIDLFGGGMFSSFVKRERIRDANSDIKEISRSLSLLNKELEDVNMHLPAEISDAMSDNIFTDIRVQGEIKEQMTELKNFRSSVIELIEKLNSEIETYER